jgi:hypothetical protein
MSGGFGLPSSPQKKLPGHAAGPLFLGGLFESLRLFRQQLLEGGAAFGSAVLSHHKAPSKLPCPIKNASSPFRLFGLRLKSN